MALFNFHKDGQKEEENPEELLTEEELAEIEDDEAHELNDGRRFFFVAEELVPVKAGVVAQGVVHGRIDLGDEIFIYQPSKPILRASVQGMDAAIESYIMKIQTATDMAVNLLIPANPADVEKYAVITSIKPQFKVTEGNWVENPVLAALLYEKRLFANEEFFNLVCFMLAHGRFLTPAQVGDDLQQNPDGTLAIGMDAEIGFCMIQDPKNKNATLFPVFTDLTELNRWESMAEDPSVKNVALDFAKVAAITRRPDCSGFVVNPYSGNQSIITKETIRAIVQSEGYQQMFPD